MGFMKPTDVIPHRDPMVFVSEIYEVNPGVSAKGVWHLTGDEWFFPGHFPGRPTLPGVMQIESLAQMGAIALLQDDRYQGKLALFGGVDKARFRRQVLPGDSLELEMEMHSMSARAGKGSGTAAVNGEIACKAELFFVVVDA
jgi:3-hydroxyacyl-[acyl-carrier-protein] dehydratase